MTKKSFCSSWLKKWNGAIDDCWYHVTLIPVSLAIHGKSYVAHWCDCLNFMIRMVLLTMIFISHDADTSVNSIK